MVEGGEEYGGEDPDDGKCTATKTPTKCTVLQDSIDQMYRGSSWQHTCSHDTLPVRAQSHVDGCVGGGGGEGGGRYRQRGPASVAMARE
jgi:hypothetical protein